MGKLDARGVIAAIEIVVYIPLLATSILLVLRHGAKRSAGWLFFLIFSTVRIVGAAIHIASEISHSTSTTLHIIYSIMESVGLQPLLGATLGFLATIAQNGLDSRIIITRGLKLLGLLSTVALALSIAGAVTAGDATTQDDVHKGSTMRHAGGLLFLFLYLFIIAMHGYYWANKDHIMRHRRRLLLGISLALPFIGVRVLFSLLSAFAPSFIPGTTPPTGGLSKFNSQSGSWVIYLVMSVLAELFTVSIYTIVGITTPLSEDFAAGNSGVDEELILKPQHPRQRFPY